MSNKKLNKISRPTTVINLRHDAARKLVIFENRLNYGKIALGM